MREIQYLMFMTCMKADMLCDNVGIIRYNLAVYDSPRFQFSLKEEKEEHEIKMKNTFKRYFK